MRAAIKISASYYLCLLSFKTRWHLPDSARQSSQSKWLQRCTPIKGAPAQIPRKQTFLLIVFKSIVCTLAGVFSFLITHRRKQPTVVVFFFPSSSTSPHQWWLAHYWTSLHVPATSAHAMNESVWDLHVWKKSGTKKTSTSTMQCSKELHVMSANRMRCRSDTGGVWLPARRSDRDDCESSRRRPIIFFSCIFFS